MILMIIDHDNDYLPLTVNPTLRLTMRHHLTPYTMSPNPTSFSMSPKPTYTTFSMSHTHTLYTVAHDRLILPSGP